MDARDQVQSELQAKGMLSGTAGAGALGAAGGGGAFAPGGLIPGLPHPVPSRPPQGPYLLWLDYGTEGWSLEECETLADCFDYMRSVAHGGKYRITREVKVEIREATA